MARPSKLTPELQEQFCAALKAGHRLEDVCEEAGISRKTLHRWMTAGERKRFGPQRAFYLAVSKALRETRGALLRVVERASRYDARAAIYLLSRHPLEAHSRPRSTTSGQTNGGEEWLTNLVSEASGNETSTVVPRRRGG